MKTHYEYDTLKLIVSYRIDAEDVAVKPLSLHRCETLQHNKILLNSDTHTSISTS